MGTSVVWQGNFRLSWVNMHLSMQLYNRDLLCFSSGSEHALMTPWCLWE